MKRVHVLDYKAGNVRSLRNALGKCGVEPVDVEYPEQLLDGTVTTLVFPGVGAFGAAMAFLNSTGYRDALKTYLEFCLDPTKPHTYLGICLGLQTLFEGSAEGDSEGLGVFEGRVERFDESELPVPHIGWAGVNLTTENTSVVDSVQGKAFYFVHSFRVEYKNQPFVSTTTKYGDREYVSSVAKVGVFACQFHPEKSSTCGLEILRTFLELPENKTSWSKKINYGSKPTRVLVRGVGNVRRVVACLDVRTNDDGDLVVTKGESYDVRESATHEAKRGKVRNLGKPVDLALRYYEEGADEIVFLNITSFKAGNDVLNDAPMLEVLKRASAEIFVPLTVGGGIKDVLLPNGKMCYAIDVADAYFRAGADKISLGSDAVFAAEQYYASGSSGKSSIETISKKYGAQAVVISVDPRRVYLKQNEETSHAIVELPDGRRCWYQCTVKGGREGRDMDVVQLAKACEALGAGELLVNCIDSDGANSGYDLALLKMVCESTTLPVVASSGAGRPQHFEEAFNLHDSVRAALAAGIFHRKEVGIDQVKTYLQSQSRLVRLC